MMFHASRQCSAALVPLIVATVLLGLANPVSARPRTTYVHQGHSIQAAINSAHPGDRIIVTAGTYAEQLTISKDGIALIGQGAVIVPPSSPVNNTCSGLAGPDFQTGLDTQTGICITGSNVGLANFTSEHRKFVSVGYRVKGVSVTGFTVRNFTGINIAIVAAQDAVVTQNKLTDGAAYSALTVGSINSQIEHNTITAGPRTAQYTFLPFIGICMDDVGPVTVSQNDISAVNIGLCLQTSGANVHNNFVHNCCIGAFADPGVTGIKFLNNLIKDTNPACKNDSSGSFGIWGVIISASVDAVLEGNRISGITSGGRPDYIAAGVAILDDTFSGTGDVATGNTVILNVLSNNDVDVQVSTNGTGNTVILNECKVSSPVGLCH